MYSYLLENVVQRGLDIFRQLFLFWFNVRRLTLLSKFFTILQDESIQIHSVFIITKTQPSCSCINITRALTISTVNLSRSFTKFNFSFSSFSYSCFSVTNDLTQSAGILFRGKLFLSKSSNNFLTFYVKNLTTD